MRMFPSGTVVAFWALLVFGSSVLGQAPPDRVIFDGAKLAEGLDMGVNTSGGRTDWVGPNDGAMRMAYPPNQAWGAVFITVGRPKDPPRPGWDLSGYVSLLVEVRGDPGTTLEIGVKDATQPDDGAEQKVIVPLYSTYRTYAIPMRSFNRADARRLYVVCEFVFSGAQGQTAWFRNIKYSAQRSPGVDAVVHGASFRSGAAAGTWISLVGQDLAPVSRTWDDADFDGKKLPKVLSGVGVTISERAAAVAYVSPAQVNALVLHDTPVGQSYVSVTTSVGTSVPLRVVVQPAYHGLFVLSPEGGRYAAAVHLDGTIVGKPSLFGSAVVTRPAKPGDTVQLFGTGFGPSVPLSVADEVLPAPLPLANPANLTVRLGSVSVPVDFVGLVGPGLYQLNLRIPSTADGDQRLLIDLGTSAMQQEVYLTVQR